MPVSIKIGDEQEVEPVVAPEDKPAVSVSLNIRKTMDGDLMIFDHADIDIIIMKKKQKVVAFPKDIMSEVVYGAQDRLFKFMQSKGLIMPESVKSGNIYGSLEASYPLQSKYADTTNVALYLVYEFMQDEGKFLQLKVDMEREENERLMDPSAADSTELGEVPHEERKGTQGVIDYYPAYYYGSLYE